MGRGFGLLLDDDRDDKSDCGLPAFGMLMDDDRDDGGAMQFGRARMGRPPRRVMSRYGRAFRGFGDEYTWPGSPYENQDGYVTAQPIAQGSDPGTPIVTGADGGSSGSGSGGSTDWWTPVGKAVDLSTQIAGGIIKIATNQNCPSGMPFYSPVTRQCYPTAAAAQAASGGGGLFVVGALGLGLLIWLARG